MVDGGVRAAGDGQGMVPVVAPHEVHHFPHVWAPEGVAVLEPHVGLVPRTGRGYVAAVDDEVGQAHRDRLALLDRAVLPGLNVRGDLDGAAIPVEEPESVPTARG